MKQLSNNRQLAVNMGASFATFIVAFGVNFFLTPYVVGSLGREAYGFVSLASNILSYTSLLTVALNSMAGRFVTVKYVSGDTEGANRYFASVFYSNLVFATIILVVGSSCFVFLDSLINIPQHLVWDVKLLFAILLLNNVMSLVTSIWSVSTFIKNRLDLTNVRGVFGTLMNAVILLILFGFFSPHIWYIGLAGMVGTIYVAGTNRWFSIILTPDLLVRRANFELAKVVELVKSGSWNLVSRLGELLSNGLDLLLANLFISPSMMGIFAISKTLPLNILRVFATISGVFAPLLTTLWAQGRWDELKHEFLKTVRILGFFANVPLVGLMVLGKDFYSLWLPGENASLLQLITVVGSVNYVVSMPLEGLWNIFTITNRLKVSTLSMLALNILVFVTWLVILPYVTTDEGKMLVFVGVRVFWNNLKNLFFLPIYGAYCLHFPQKTFYKPLIKSVLCFALSCIVCFSLHALVSLDSWLKFSLGAIILLVVCFGMNWFVILQSHDRCFVLNVVLTRVFRRRGKTG